MTAIERVIATARAEIGYIEKATNSQLEDKTANAGSGNWTKYAAFLDGLGVYNFPKTATPGAICSLIGAISRPSVSALP